MEPYYGGNSAQGMMQGIGNQLVSQPTIRQRLDIAVKQAEERLAAVKEAKKIFERNPDMEKLLDIMQRSNF